MQSLKTVIPIWAIAIILCAGCKSDAPIEARGEQFDFPWLTVGSPDLRKDTMVSDARRSRDEFGLMRVTIPVRSTNDKQLYVDYRVVFLDAQGMEVGVPQTGTLTIPQRGSRNLTAKSTSPRAESFHVELTYPRVN